ncbi:lysylphosphatidylglycerol synthase domain-containing protein [Leifsonia sp. NPDC080035]|uniref:Lysylphosphatidylglycerol synthase domain-containing protein n=1 Tax=Leifsonia sp. NPDC080035 TaxID=3143936 RepID=A0AAU7GHB6_9MICO
MTLRLGAATARDIPARAAVPGLHRLVAARWFRPTVRGVAGAVVLVAIVAQVGAGPFLRGLAGMDGAVLAAAVALSAVATAAAAWRWRAIAARLGAPIAWREAVGMYYRSQFLNTVLPGGVLGDVHRAVDHGRGGARAAAARAVVLERSVGQVVQLGIAAAVLLAAGVGLAGALLPVVVLGTAVVVMAAAVGVAWLASGRVRLVLNREAAELRTALGAPGVCAQAVAASVVVCACHIGTFTIAAAAVGASAPPLGMLSLAVLALLAASIPLNVGGWGPREGAAGWAFAAAGLGAGTGVAAATLFGVLALLSVAPGALVATVAAVRRRRT